MEYFGRDKNSIINHADFAEYWKSLQLKKSKSKQGTAALASYAQAFMEIQDLGINITDDTNRQIISKIIDEFDKSGKSKMDVLREIIIDALSSDEVIIQIDRAYFKEITLNKDFTDEDAPFGMMRDGLFYELGLRFPKFTISFTDKMDHGNIQFKVNNVVTKPFTGLRKDQCLVNDTVDRLTLLNIKGTPAINPANGLECSITSTAYAEIAEQAGITTWDGLGYLVLIFSGILRDCGRSFVTGNQVNNELDKLATAWPELIEGLRNRYTTATITKTLRLLISELVSIRNLRLIIMSMLEMDTIKTDPRKYIILDDRLPLKHLNKDTKDNPENIAEFVRSKMKEYISHKYTRGGNTLIVYLLDPEIEEIFEISDKDNVELVTKEHERILQAITTEVENLPPTAQNPVILTYNTIRSSIRKFVSERFPNLAVLAYTELSPTINIQPIARITMQ